MSRVLLKIGGIAVLLVAIIAGAFLFLQNQAESAEDTRLTFETSPSEVQVSIDGVDYGTVISGDSLVAPLRSEVDIAASREGFTTYTATVEINPGNPYTLTVELPAETTEGEEILSEEQEIESEQEATEAYLAEGERLYDENPILHDLPQHGEEYSAYQGLPEASGYDWAIHLHLYDGYEDQGREAFHTWLTTNGYDADDYEIIERIEEETPPLALPEGPTWEDLEETTPTDVEIPTDITAEGLDHGELGLLFAEVTATWDTTDDVHHTEGLIRATPLMTEERAATVELPFRPTTTPVWREAASFDSRSIAWVIYYEEDSTDVGTEISMDVCWAWVTEDTYVIVDGPRDLDLTVTDTNNGPRVDTFTYNDPDPFVDNTDTHCRPDDAP